MKYMGSKNRHAKDLLPIILKDRKPYEWYIEPFVGGCNIIDKVGGVRVGCDNNKYLIRMWEALQCKDFEIPYNDITEEDYNLMRNYVKDKNKVSLYLLEKYPKYLEAIIGFVSIGCSYGGKFFGGWARGKNSKGEERNYCYESYKNVMNQKEKIKDIHFYHCDYKQLSFLPSHSIIYCDPPYQKTTKYKTSNFNHREFWEWCENRVREGYKVFVSEYNAPADWQCVWKKEVNNSLTKNTGAKVGIEKLFTKN